VLETHRADWTEFTTPRITQLFEIIRMPLQTEVSHLKHGIPASVFF